MSGRIAFDFDVLTDQAQKTDQFAGDVLSAAGSLGAGLGGRAFGTLGGFVVGPLQGVSGAASAVCGDSQTALANTAAQLRALAADVQETEAEIVSALREIERELGYEGSR